MGPVEQVVDHPEPGLATVKELYAHAFSCAKPDCNEWLYRQESGALEPVLNSRVAHIHARRQGGPRWNPDMTSAENRSTSNLLLLCIPHSYEIDNHADRYPAELLQEWRIAQRAEHDRFRRAWPLDDDEAVQVLRTSFAAPTVTGTVLVSVARAAEALALHAESTRHDVAQVAATWRASWESYRRRPVGWDSDGNSVYASPPRMETLQHQDAVVQALNRACEMLQPFINDAKTEATVVSAAHPEAARWTQWVHRSADEVARAASRWPGPPPQEDDGSVSTAVAELRIAASALASALRGAVAPEPPREEAEPSPTSTVTPADERLQDHKELLERARPHARVTHRTYDATLRRELVSAAVDAATLPPVVATLTFGLEATASLAAQVAKNAEPDVIRDLIESDARQEPICVAVALLIDMARILRQRGDTALAERAGEAALTRVRVADWADPATWIGNEYHGRHTFAAWTWSASADETREHLAEALDANPEVVRLLVPACASWVEQHGPDEVRLERRYDDQLPEWLPWPALRKALGTVFPAVRPATDEFDDRIADETERLVSHLLRLGHAEAADDL